MRAKLCFLSILSIFLSTEARFTGGRGKIPRYPGGSPPRNPPDYSPGRDYQQPEQGNDYHLSWICQALAPAALKPLCGMLDPPQTPQSPPGQPTNNTAPEVQPKSAQIGEDYGGDPLCALIPDHPSCHHAIMPLLMTTPKSQDYQVSQENQQGCGIFPCRGPGIPFEKYAQIGGKL